MDKKQAAKVFLEVFPNYVQLYKQLSTEYDLTPEWRFIRKHKLSNRIHRLNVDYLKWYQNVLAKSISQS